MKPTIAHDLIHDVDTRFTENNEEEWIVVFYEKGFDELSSYLTKRMAFWKYLEPDGFV